MYPVIESKPSSEIKAFQEKKLVEQLIYLKEKSPFYRELFHKNHIDITKIKSLEDLALIPPTTKDDLQQRNHDFVCVPKNRIIDYITTSGTLGDPVTFAMTDHDLDRLAYNESISFSVADGNSNDLYQLMTTIDRRFMAGLAYFLGVRKLGAGIIRVGNGMPELQWDSIRRFSPNAFITVPSFILKLIEYAEENAIDYRSSSIRKAICIGEPLRNPDFSLTTLSRKIKEKWDIMLYSTYASTEMGTAFTECRFGCGGHHHPELIIVEFLDEHDRPVGEEEAGEVTITTLGVEGMPLLRFKTGDVCHHYHEPCRCGRTTMRLGPVLGRKQQMIKYKGTTLYPPALYDILDNMEHIVNYYVEVYTNQIGTDEILIHIGSHYVSDTFEKQIKDHFRAKLRVAPQVVFEPVEQVGRVVMPEGGRKSVKFLDKRNNHK
ncbi:MAG: AMP-binding protein [Bacteroidales bacterium]|nr:AMP-binding protein [Bacteroidales bacterium]